MKGEKELAEDRCLKIDLSDVPTGSRLEKYLKAFPSMLNPGGLFDLLRNVHTDCMIFLKVKLDAGFPAMVLRWCNSREFEDAVLVQDDAVKSPMHSF